MILRSGTLGRIDKIDISDVSEKEAIAVIKVMKNQKVNSEKIEFFVFDECDLETYHWLKKRGANCDYSSSREMVYFNDNMLEHLVFVDINGFMLNMSEDDFGKFKKGLGLREMVLT